MHKIAIAAIKQSGNLWLPNIHEPCNFDQLFKSIDPFKNRFIAHCISSQKKVLNKLIQQNDSQLILIGPEGDFNKDELDMALKNGFKGDLEQYIKNRNCRNSINCYNERLLISFFNSIFINIEDINETTTYDKKKYSPNRE